VATIQRKNLDAPDEVRRFPRPATVIRPTPADLRAAQGRAILDTVAPGLDVLFVGINPGLYSGATGHHFARPGNRFWPTLHRAGFTPRQLQPDETDALLAQRLGITNIVNRTTATAAELDADELRQGGDRLRATVARHRPRVVAVLGVTAYRAAFGRPKATIGRQPEPLEGAELWVLPNPSGLNAHYQLPQLVELFGQFREAIGRPRAG
jgi:TDG/mug DNA glycosylase family protein